MTGQEMISCWMLVEFLTREEASAVTISNPNPDFSGPAFIIDVSGPWAHYEGMQFSGDSVLECLDKANRARLSAAE